MKMIEVDSRAISHIGYDNKTLGMKITFKQSGTYNYCNVPQSIFDEFLNASSVGTYYAQNIKDEYNCEEYFN